MKKINNYSNKEDLLWEDCKKHVDKKWGRKCLFNKCISITESKLLKDGSPKKIDRCHILSRSEYPRLKYDPNNIVPLQRFIHQRMDGYKDPITDEFCDLNMHYYWWVRILERKVLKYDPEIDYEYELKKILNVV